MQALLTQFQRSQLQSVGNDSKDEDETDCDEDEEEDDDEVDE